VPRLRRPIEDARMARTVAAASRRQSCGGGGGCGGERRTGGGDRLCQTYDEAAARDARDSGVEECLPPLPSAGVRDGNCGGRPWSGSRGGGGSRRPWTRSKASGCGLRFWFSRRGRGCPGRPWWMHDAVAAAAAHDAGVGEWRLSPPSADEQGGGCGGRLWCGGKRSGSRRHQLC